MLLTWSIDVIWKKGASELPFIFLFFDKYVIFENHSSSRARVRSYFIAITYYYSLQHRRAAKMDPRFSDETRQLMSIIPKYVTPPGSTLDINTMRRNISQLHVVNNAEFMTRFKGTLEEKIVKTDTAEIPISIYTPTDVQKDKLGIFFHGGGWTRCDRETHQAIVNYIAETTKIIWISVEYRLGPEHKYPIWLDDSAAVTQYIIENKTSFGVNETAKVGLAGDSAGGTISASLARDIKGIDFQILIYAGLDLCRQTPSYKEFVAPMYLLPPEHLDWIYRNAYENAEDYKIPRVDALAYESFEGLPPCLFIVAELDPLRDANLEYQKRLEKAGVPTKLALIKGVVHGFFGLPGIFPQACAESIEAVDEFLKTI